MTQTILGSGGSIGIPLARELGKFSDHIRLVSRNPKKVNETDELFPMNLKDFSRIDEAIAGSDVVFVTVGFEYNLKVWRSVWPAFMNRVIVSCERHNARLVFFDNIYIYARSAVPHMIEDSPLQPPSEKGKIRLKLHEMIMNKVEKNKLSAIITRSADFYGPGNKNSPLILMVADNLVKGKKAQAFGNINKIHTFTYTPDAAKATAILGNTPDAFNKVWHVPTTRQKLTTLNWIEMVAREVNKEPEVQVVPAWLIRILGIFMPVMREFPEMLYQYEEDYVLDSTRFEKQFGFGATPPEEGVRKMMESYRK
jgi:nucleoside-diphosphate-sugar epimerase